MDKIELFTGLLTKIDEFERKSKSPLQTYSQHIKDVLEIVINIDLSWSRSWIGFHASLYYGDFERPPYNETFDKEWGGLHSIPVQWQEKTTKDIIEYIEKTVTKPTEEIAQSLMHCFEEAEKLSKEFSIELQILRDMDGFEKEIEILDKIEKIKWFITPETFWKSKMPTQILTRDQFAASQGIIVPPHIAYESHQLSLKSMYSGVSKFLNESKDLLQRILRRLEYKQSPDDIHDTSIQKVKLICKRFHLVTRQLRQRHSDRTTFVIDDEYDVQDLLHSLLKIFFDDVRAEEYAPSYAGSSSRMDFLLKSEKIVIEVKKTRKKLEGKEVGKQLIDDIAHYNTHPDCKTLVCFVYDPEGRIGNPRGLETDLNRISDELSVIVFIEPSF